METKVKEPVKSMGADDSRSRAAARAAELRGHIGDLDEGTDEFYIPSSMVPDGWTYEWKRHTIFGQEDPAYQVQLAREGWTPVPAARHPQLMPAGQAEGAIMRKGMVLVECPSEIIEERRSIEHRRARKQVRDKESSIAGTPEGTLTRDDPRVRPNIKKSYQAMPIPKE